jgi:hypothetical protein
MTKLKINREVSTLYIDGDTLTSIIDEFQGLVDIYGPETFVSLEEESYSDNKYLALIVPTLESDAEYEARVGREKAIAEKRKQWTERWGTASECADATFYR